MAVQIPAVQKPFRPSSRIQEAIVNFREEIRKAQGEIRELEIELDKIQPVLDEEAKGLHKLKSVPAEERSQWDEWKIRSKSRKFRELADESKSVSDRAKEKRGLVERDAVLLVKFYGILMGGLIHKVDLDLLVFGKVLDGDRLTFEQLLRQETIYRDLTSAGVPRGGGTQTLDPNWYFRAFSDWRKKYEAKILDQKEKLNALRSELRISKIRERISREETGPFEIAPTQGGRDRDSKAIQKDIHEVETDVDILQNSLAALEHLRRQVQEDPPSSGRGPLPSSGTQAGP